MMILDNSEEGRIIKERESDRWALCVGGRWRLGEERGSEACRGACVVDE